MAVIRDLSELEWMILSAFRQLRAPSIDKTAPSRVVMSIPGLAEVTAYRIAPRYGKPTWRIDVHFERDADTLKVVNE